MPVRSNMFVNSYDLPVHAETRRRGGLMVVDDAADAFLERGTTEIDEKAHGLAGQAKIGQQLFAMSRVQPFDGFDFQQQTAIDQQIDTKGRVEARAFKIERKNGVEGKSVSVRENIGGDRIKKK